MNAFTVKEWIENPDFASVFAKKTNSEPVIAVNED
jgi:hypothetical protein